MFYNKYIVHKYSTFKDPMLPLSGCFLPSTSILECGWNVGKTTTLIIIEYTQLNIKIFWRFWLLSLSCLPFYLDHEKSGNSTTSFIQIIIKTQKILKVSKDFGGKLCTSNLFINGVKFIAAILLIMDQL